MTAIIVPSAMTVGLMALELLMAVIQAYVLTMLATIPEVGQAHASPS